MKTVSQQQERNRQRPLDERYSDSVQLNDRPLAHAIKKGLFIALLYTLCCTYASLPATAQSGTSQSGTSQSNTAQSGTSQSGTETRQTGDIAPLMTQTNTLKIGVLYPQGGAMVRDRAALEAGIEAALAQVDRRYSVVGVEVLTDTITDEPTADKAALNRLLDEGVVALIAPSISIRLFNAPAQQIEHELFIDPLYATAPYPQTLGQIMQGRFSGLPALSDAFEQLKFQGKLQRIIVLVNESEPFSQFGGTLFAEKLTAERVPFSMMSFSIDGDDGDTSDGDNPEETATLSDVLNQIKRLDPDATLIFSGWDTELAVLMSAARDDLRLTGHIMGLTPQTVPMLFDLAEESRQGVVSGMAWEISAPPSEIHALAAAMQLEPLALRTRLAFSFALLGAAENPTDRAALHRAFADQGRYNLLDSALGAKLLFLLRIAPALDLPP